MAGARLAPDARSGPVGRPMHRAAVKGTVEVSGSRPEDVGKAAVNGYSNPEPSVAGRRIRQMRRRRLQQTPTGTTTTDSWPPRLDTAL
jgi:hypothetical protein